MNKDCPTRENLQHFLSSEMFENERDTLELHLADCADCRRGLALMFSESAENFTAPDLLKETVKNLPKPKVNSASFFSFDWLKINRLQIGFATVFIVCFAFAGVYIWQNQTTSNSDDVLRNGASKNEVFKLLAPKDDVKLTGGKIMFRWSQLPNVKTYTLVISDEKGDIIEEIPSDKPQFETSVSELGLEKEKRYFWHVKAKFTDGLTAETESRKLFFVHR